MGMGLGSGMVPLHPLLHSFWELKLYTVAWHLLHLTKASKTLVKSLYFLHYLFYFTLQTSRLPNHM
jgi:hypothetical protein